MMKKERMFRCLLVAMTLLACGARPESALSQRLSFGLVPIEANLNHNTKRPYGFNDGPVWAGRGNNASFSGGVWLESRFLSLSINPIAYYAENRDFVPALGMISEYSYSSFRMFDLPYRFGELALSEWDPGESYVNLHVGWFEVGAATSVIRWGPGVRNGLIFGGHAAGIPRVYLSSRRPVKLPLRFGAIEYDLIWGKPERSFLAPDRLDRFMAGFEIKYAPTFVRGLQLGVTRLFQTYIPESGITLTQIIDPFDPFQKANLGRGERADLVNNGDQMVSVFAEVAVDRHGGRIYGEFARMDHNWDLRDGLVNPHNSRGYLIGALKYFGDVRRGSDRDPRITGETDPREDLVGGTSLLLEMVNTSSTVLDQVRLVAPMYVGGVYEGHTNKGQILGAGVGPGGISYFAGVEHYRQWGQLGASFERMEISEHRYFEARDNLKPVTSDAHRVNLLYSVQASFIAEPFVLSPQLVLIRVMNDGWQPKNDYWNVHLGLTASYRFTSMQWKRR